MHKITVSVVEATGLLSIGKTTLFALMREGQLQRIKVGRKTLVTVQSIQDFIAGQLHGEAE
jgi:excisionase family DNA binding protein